MSAPSSAAMPERTLILGWNARVPAIVSGIDAYSSAGSELLVVTADPEAASAIATLAPSLSRVELGQRMGDVADRRVLDALDLKTWNHVMVLPPDRIAAYAGG